MTAALSIQNPYGGYRTLTKVFKDDRHLDNYIDYMSRKGYKIIGVEKIK